ncbi:MAG: DUF3990 domain-containing protein, partial [Erysipelotrichaceae bacterium]|nr:DUF3990 domain-containing protein [Erysipelotrichaceae bacterium]
MKKEILKIKDRDHLIFSDEDPEFIILEVVGKEEAETLDEQIRIIKEETGRSFIMAAFFVEDWNRELSPWEAPPVFGKEGFGEGARETLDTVTDVFIPGIRKRYALNDVPIILCGYSLAGLFALWSAYQTDIFRCVAAVSPSVWFPDWLEYMRQHEPHTEYVYLSLGNREEKTKNKVMATVGECIRKAEEILKEKDIRCLLEWNEGNHFNDPEGRCARGIVSCIKDLSKKKIRLYHTGFDVIPSPDISTGRKNADFGKGFYLSDDREFSKRWARQRKDMTTRLNSYELDPEGLNIKELNRDQEWFDYIYDNRSGQEDVLSGYDVIIGPIANDTIYDTWGITTSGLLKPADALRILSVGPEYTQTVLKT